MASILKCYGDCIGPLGFPMKSGVAREVEALLAGLNSDCKSYLAKQPSGIARRGYEPTEVIPRKKELGEVSVINTATLDRDNEIVLPRGAGYASFAKGGGPVTLCHCYSRATVGRSPWLQPSWGNAKLAAGPLWAAGDALAALTLYHPRPGKEVLPENQRWEPAEIHYLGTECGMRGKSIGFVPLDLGRPTKQESDIIPGAAEASCIIRKWELLEYAVAPVQSNPDAVLEAAQKMKAAGLGMPAAWLQATRVILTGFSGDADLEQGPAEKQAEKAITVPELKAALAERVKAIDLHAICKRVREKMRGTI